MSALRVVLLGIWGKLLYDLPSYYPTHKLSCPYCIGLPHETVLHLVILVMHIFTTLAITIYSCYRITKIPIRQSFYIHEYYRIYFNRCRKLMNFPDLRILPHIPIVITIFLLIMEICQWFPYRHDVSSLPASPWARRPNVLSSFYGGRWV